MSWIVGALNRNMSHGRIDMKMLTDYQNEKSAKEAHNQTGPII
jgi:hypothetical protein